MKQSFVFILMVALTIFVSSCNSSQVIPSNNDIGNNQVLGRLVVNISGVGSEVMVSNAHFTPTTLNTQALTEVTNVDASSFALQNIETFVSGGKRYINVVYTFTNGGVARELTLVGVADTSTIGSTPFKSIKAYNGSAINNNSFGLAMGTAKSYSYITNAVETNPSDGYVNGLNVGGITAGPNETILPEGFKARTQDLSNTVILPNAQARVTLSTSFNTTNDSSTEPFTFNMLFVLAAETITSTPSTACSDPLQAGDIAITGISADNEEFTFVALCDIASGTEITFTDSGVLNTGSFRGDEGAVKFTAPYVIQAGTIVKYDGTLSASSGFSSANDAIVGQDDFSLNREGDQVIAFIGSSNNPTFIFAAQTNSNQFQANSTSSTDSALPTNLTVGTTAVAVGAGPSAGNEFDNSQYNRTLTTGQKASLLTAIANSTNWTGSNSPITLSTNMLTVNPTP